jgi:catechol 2,3-dioxygenase-like lactoylglutathione lyase family enzyme
VAQDGSPSLVAGAAPVSAARGIMVETHGLTHIALAVSDLARSTRFYEHLLGARIVYRDAAFVQLQTPGTHDVIVLEHEPKHAGKAGGVVHFGFRLQRPEDIDAAIAAVATAGGRVKSHGEFVPGEPYVFAEDPDGYEVELWYELPTPFDPPARPRRAK